MSGKAQQNLMESYMAAIPFSKSKRALVRTGSIAGLGIVIGTFGPAVVSGPAIAQEKKGVTDKLKEWVGLNKPEVSPPEDLMREHGVLDRVLLVYEASIRKLSANHDFDPAVITESAQIVRDFINNYHEKSEENYVFPRFTKAGSMVELVDTLLQQHQAGRHVTEVILRLAPGSRQDGDDRKQLVGAIQSFITMYRPHAAREDTDLFPKLKDLVSSNEYDSMAEEFEKEEHKAFGEDGFGKMVDRVAKLEQAIGINDLNQFTPKAG
jgi:hemerythrin-like domain-containing protein